MAILLTGAKGQLGNEIRVLTEHRLDLRPEMLYTDLEELNITDGLQIQRLFQSKDIDICINAAAYTAVDQAESEQVKAFAINAEATEKLAHACDTHGTLLIQLSTDFVFDGKIDKPYSESAAINPLGIYGQSKAEGEKLALSTNDKTILIRTSWLYSSFGHNFVKTIMRLAAEKEQLKVVDDQIGSPTYARDLAEVILAFIDKYHQESSLDYGIYHYSNAGHCSWFDLAEQIVRLADLPCRVLPIPSKDYPTAAQRPAYSAMDTHKITNYLNLSIPSWKKSLEDCISLLKQINYA